MPFTLSVLTEKKNQLVYKKTDLVEKQNYKKKE